MTMTELSLLPYSSHDWRGYVAPDWREAFQDFDAWLAQQPQERIVDKPTRQVLRVTSPQATVYVKTVSSLVDGRHVWLDVLKRLKWRLRPSRAIRTLRIMRTMLDAGVRCPEPLLAIRRRRHPFASPEDIIVTRELAMPTLHAAIMDTAPEQRADLLRQALPDIFDFHHRGFVHGDFLAGNMMWDGQHVYFIDHDRTWRRLPQGTRDERFRNLVQFCYHLEMGTRQLELGEQFLVGYNRLAEAAYGQPLVEVDALQALVYRKLVRKIRKYDLENWLPPQP